MYRAPENSNEAEPIPEVEKYSDRKLFGLLFVSLTFSIAMNIMGYYFVVFIKRDFEGDALVVSIRQILAISLEIPTFILYPLISKYLSNERLLIISGVFIIIRSFGYVIVKNPWHLLIFECLHGVSFALFWSSTMNMIYHQEEKRKIHLLFWSIFSGLGVCLGLLLGGFLPIWLLFPIIILLNGISFSLYIWI